MQDWPRQLLTDTCGHVTQPGRPHVEGHRRYGVFLSGVRKDAADLKASEGSAPILMREFNARVHEQSTGDRYTLTVFTYRTAQFHGSCVGRGQYTFWFTTRPTFLACSHVLDKNAHKAVNADDPHVVYKSALPSICGVSRSAPTAAADLRGSAVAAAGGPAMSLPPCAVCGG